MSLSAKEMESELQIENDSATPIKSKRLSTMKYLEVAVEKILSQEDSKDVEEDSSKKENVAITPKRSAVKAVADQNKLSVECYHLAPITPRRSARKSVKPLQDYEEIVGGKRHLYSASKGQVETAETEANEEVTQRKWTPAKVGRISQKRGRKSRKTGEDKSKKSKSMSSSESEDVTNIKEVASVVDVEEKENVKPIEANEEVFEVDKEAEVLAKNENTEELITENVIKESSDVKSNDLSCSIAKKDDLVFPDSKKNDLSFSVAKKDVTKKADLSFSDIKKDDLGFSDLGLKLLEDDDSMSEKCDSNAIELKTPKETEEKLPIPLLEESSGSEIEKSQEAPEMQYTITINDDTFNTSDCVIVDVGICKPEGEMPTLQISDTEEDNKLLSPRQIAAPNDENDLHTTILSTSIEINTQTNNSFSATPTITPKRVSKSSTRKPTPYKLKENIEEPKEEDDNENESNELPVTISFTSIEPKESVLRSIRKRSISICIGDNNQKSCAKSKNVTFYSPANQTAILEDFDILVEKNIDKVHENSFEKSTFVTERRRRSKSFDETILKRTIKPQKNMSAGSTPNKWGQTPQKPIPARSKLPNFAAIHKKQFENMENLVDHVNRKKERAKELINSAVKPRKANEQKGPSQNNQSIAVTPSIEKSKTLKRVHPDITTKPTNITINKTMKEAEIKPRIGGLNLPDPRVGIIKPITMHTPKNKQKPPTPAKNALKPTQLIQVPTRPAFSLSTSMHSHNIRNQTVPVTNNARATEAVNAQPTATTDDKISARRQRHMDLFKGRTANARTAADKQFIRGVRSNRRFELQMKHRQNLEKN